MAPETLRERKIRSGMSGLRAVASRTTKAASSASETRAEPERAARAPAVVGRRLDDRVDAEHQRARDQDRARDVGAVAEADALVAVEQPQRQHGGRRSPIGTLTKKIQCQLIDCVSTPPASSPTEPPAEATKP